MTLLQKEIAKIINNAIKEDCVDNDITTNSLIDKNQKSEAYIISRQDAVVCGTTIVQQVFKIVDPKVTVFAYRKEGERISKNEPLIFIKGSTRSILSGERLALNFLGRLSGIATLTSQYVEKAGPKVKILDTRKTTPGLRNLEKMAVVTGGGTNHRFNLREMVLIKDNHRLATQKEISLAEAVSRAKKTKKKIEIEVDNIDQFHQAIAAKPDIILLDNMPPAQIRKAVSIKKLLKSKTLLEASGGINLKTVSVIAKSGVDRISVGKITHSAPCVDYSLEFVT